MVDVKEKKVIFAEANKKFVAFIFSLITLPLSSVTKAASLGMLYKTIASLDRQCFEQNVSSSSVLKPRAPVSVPLLSFPEVIGGTMYMVADNLEVKPMSISLIKSRVKEFDVLEEKQVQVGLQEVYT
ncbi:hypothetical protein RND81_01G074700 [Saponaria officinalis]|uniref:Uncharacterized protein n=1 Tax=Saponaria officinalis TaxID=3572 RepID=A0AAW1NDP3_SAPOF